MKEKADLDDASEAQLSRTAKALSDPIRIRMLQLLSQGHSGCCSALRPESCGALEGLCVCELQDSFRLGQSKVSYHLRVLSKAGLVKESRVGKWTFYSIDVDAVGKLVRWVQDVFRLDEGGNRRNG